MSSAYPIGTLSDEQYCNIASIQVTKLYDMMRQELLFSQWCLIIPPHGIDMTQEHHAIITRSWQHNRLHIRHRTMRACKTHRLLSRTYPLKLPLTSCPLSCAQGGVRQILRILQYRHISNAKLDQNSYSSRLWAGNENTVPVNAKITCCIPFHWQHQSWRCWWKKCSLMLSCRVVLLSCNTCVLWRIR